MSLATLIQKTARISILSRKPLKCWGRIVYSMQLSGTGFLLRDYAVHYFRSFYCVLKIFQLVIIAYFHCRTRDSDSDSDSDSKHYGYIVLCKKKFSLTWTWIRIPFPNGYCTHFRDGSLSSQGQISVLITYISISWSESKSEPMEKSVYESESESGNRNNHYIWSLT